MTEKKYSDKALAAQLADKVQALPDNWLMCRDMRHAWEVSTDYHVSAQKGTKVKEIRRVLSCLRCTTERHERYHITTWGLDKVGQSYKYPYDAEGMPYQIHGVPRGVKPSYIIQGEQYRRVMERLAEAEKKAGGSNAKTLKAV